MKGFFCGWYFKVESKECSLALIPAVNGAEKEAKPSLQILWDGTSRNLSPLGRGNVIWQRPRAILGQNLFCPHGILLSMEEEGWSIQGRLFFSPLKPPKLPIMGPFEWIPGMECSHRIASMEHRVDGEMTINGRRIRFENARGYIEGDRGRSFPREYAWTQCLFPEGSLMMAAARVPVGPAAFSGVIALLHVRGWEYRFASYLGARLVRVHGGRLVIRQGALTLSAERMGREGQPLRAPVDGAMERIIHENLCCPVRYELRRNGRLLWKLESNRASFELEYPE